MLGITFAANAGGIATVIGTPPNSVLIGLLENQYDIQISFVTWMSFGFPFSILMITAVYFVLVKWMFPCKGIVFTASANITHQELEKLGKISSEEKKEC